MSEVLCADLRTELGVDRLRDAIRRLGIKVHGNGKLRAISQAEADVVRQFYKQRNREAAPVTETKIIEPKICPVSFPVLYVLSLVKDLKPERLKIGFSDRLSERLSEHKTAAPTLELLKTWPCQRSWEKAAIAAISLGEKQVGPEVFDFTSIDAALRRGDKFFSLLPRVETINCTTTN